MESVRILDLKIHKTTIDQLIGNIVAGIRESKKLKIFHLNVHAFNVAFKDPDFKNIINNGDLVFCDGFGVKIGAGILGLSIGDRMTPPDWIDNLCSVLEKNYYSIYLLGDEPGVAEKCAAVLLEKHPALNIKGTHHGFFGKEGKENTEVINIINKTTPDVLLVGFGMPLQEKWISANIENINSNVFISVGAMFRWIARVEKRAPLVLASNGFEWLWRLLTQPGKVWKRYTIELFVFFYKVFYTAVFGKKS
jgi:N-acetylglucosaminyldiphosphoundecaprenol N-acetyl-beta-D-mannosaminyltransferase